MNVIAANGGPRKTWNTATLLNHALEGAKSVGAEAELIHLYDLRSTRLYELLRMHEEGKYDSWYLFV